MSRKREHFLRVGRHDTDYDQLRLDRYRVEYERGCTQPISRARLTLPHTDDARRIDTGDEVEVLSRRRGTVEFGDVLFRGIVTARVPQRALGHVVIHARGHLWRLTYHVGEQVAEAASLGAYVEDWAERYMPDTPVTVTAPEPDILPPSITYGPTPLSFFRELRRYAPLHLGRVEGGGYVLEAELTPDDWAPGHERGRTLQLKYPASHPELLAPPMPPPELLGEMYPAEVLEMLRHPRRMGWVSYEYENTDIEPYRTANELVRFRPPGGVGMVYAVQRVILEGGEMIDTTTTLTYTDRVYPRYIPELMPGGPNAPCHPGCPDGDPVYFRLRDLLR